MAASIYRFKQYIAIGNSGGGNDLVVSQGAFSKGVDIPAHAGTLVDAWWAPSEGLSLTGALEAFTSLNVSKQTEVIINFEGVATALNGRVGITVYVLYNE